VAPERYADAIVRQANNLPGKARPDAVPMCSGGGYILKIEREVDTPGCTHRDNDIALPRTLREMVARTEGCCRPLGSFSVFSLYIEPETEKLRALALTREQSEQSI